MTALLSSNDKLTTLDGVKKKASRIDTVSSQWVDKRIVKTRPILSPKSEAHQADVVVTGLLALQSRHRSVALADLRRYDRKKYLIRSSEGKLSSVSAFHTYRSFHIELSTSLHKIILRDTLLINVNLRFVYEGKSYSVDPKFV